MPTRSSDIGTPQENTTERDVLSSGKTPVNPEPAVEVGPDYEESPIVETPDPVLQDMAEENDMPTELPEAIDEFGELMENGRERIDAIDDQILELVARRMEEAAILLAAKKDRGMNVRDKNRQEQIQTRLNRQTGMFIENGVVLSKNHVRELYEMLIRLGVENWRRTIIEGRRRR